MIHECEPNYRFPPRTAFIEHVIPKIYDVVVDHVQNVLTNAEAVAWTTYSWTSRLTQSYVTITSHVINHEYEMNSYVLLTQELPESHTGEHIGQVLQNAAMEWGCKVTVLTTDNASNMGIAAVTTKFPIHIGCSAHTLNIAAGKAFDVKGVNHILVKIRSLVTFLHRSTTAAVV